jgi:KGK domain
MIDQSKQVIPDADDIVCLLDEAMIEFLNSHDTYKAKSLFQALWKLNRCNNSNSSTVEILEEVLEKVYHNQSNINNSTLAKKIETFVKENKGMGIIPNTTKPFMIKPFFTEGVNCNLLQPDGKGWQKGRLKMCFEFIPDEPAPVVIKSKIVDTNSSPLDEIRQLSNELASATATEQN